MGYAWRKCTDQHWYRFVKKLRAMHMLIGIPSIRSEERAAKIEGLLRGAADAVIPHRKKLFERELVQYGLVHGWGSLPPLVQE